MSGLGVIPLIPVAIAGAVALLGTGAFWQSQSTTQKQIELEQERVRLEQIKAGGKLPPAGDSPLEAAALPAALVLGVVSVFLISRS